MNKYFYQGLVLISINEEFQIFTYNNNYIYEKLILQTPSKKSANEIRLKQEMDELFQIILKNEQAFSWENKEDAIKVMKESLLKNKIILAGVDLYYWIPLNVNYHKHHVDHYAIINGFDDEKRTYFVMDTDNVKYTEFEISEEQLMEAVFNCDYHFNAKVYDIADEREIKSYQFDKNELIYNAKRIIKSIRPIMNKYFYLMDTIDYKKGFYRDMCTMYFVQIMCRMKANRLLFEFLLEKDEWKGLQEIHKTCFRIEKGWESMKNRMSKAYFSEDCVSEVMKIDEELMNYLRDELRMWKEFIKTAKNVKGNIL